MPPERDRTIRLHLGEDGKSGSAGLGRQGEATDDGGIADAEFVGLAGARYIEPLLHAGLTIEAPMKALGIGQQLAWLTRKAPSDSVLECS